MGDFVYEGEHSVSFLVGSTWRDSWNYYRMAPQSRPYVVAPEVKEEYIDVPGMNGQLDFTEALTGAPRYGLRSGSWTFIVDNGVWDWPILYTDLLTSLHGKKVSVILSDDPLYYYYGRLSINANFGTKDYAQVTINYKFDPLKYPSGSTANIDWKWSELFNNTIIYGKFNVNGTKYRNIINEDESAKPVSITVTAAMTVTFNGETISLAAGTNTNAVTIQPGDNIMIFNGKGQVTIDYSIGGTL